MPDYIKWIRSKIGNEEIFLNFAAAIIENEDGQILLQRRNDNDKWGFPGGAFELGESAEEAAKREVLEETGYIVELNYLQGVYTKYFDKYPSGDRAQTILIAFVCNITGGFASIEDEETKDLKFFAIKDIPTLFNKQNNDMLRDFQNNKRGVYR
ncbi:NUDIX hydrolase [Paenibacillus camerounensis]|uniref:NUDIX hydrolase n=1 Tax=Paenibacillus camerounensis TaxID=1243663 RepID=UPI0005A8C766|nr:NUDIX domain-containing protein [Paenibacillus camerounensis]